MPVTHRNNHGAVVANTELFRQSWIAVRIDVTQANPMRRRRIKIQNVAFGLESLLLVENVNVNVLSEALNKLYGLRRQAEAFVLSKVPASDVLACKPVDHHDDGDGDGGVNGKVRPFQNSLSRGVLNLRLFRHAYVLPFSAST